jgi:uncharacterized YccA/Bax inhibitor family protein
MLKKIVNIVAVAVLVGLFSQSAFANVGGHGQSAPDAGSTAMLFSVAIGGLAAFKRWLR